MITVQPRQQLTILITPYRFITLLLFSHPYLGAQIGVYQPGIYALQNTNVDIDQKAANLKWDWAGHVCRMSNEQSQRPPRSGSYPTQTGDVAGSEGEQVTS